MATTVEDPRLAIGANHPPEPTPLEAFTAHVNDLFESAKDFLDGAVIETEGQAEVISKLLDDARKAENDGTEIRKAETKPLDDAKAVIMDAWRPLVDPKTGRCKLIADTCKNMLAAWLAKKEIEMRAVAEAARLDAEQKAATARSLHDSAGTDLAARETAEQALKDASKAATAAAKADRAKPQVAGGSRATGLRTSYRAEIADPTEFARWAWKHRPTDMRTFLEELAGREVRASQAPIPGVVIHADRTAV